MFISGIAIAFVSTLALTCADTGKKKLTECYSPLLVVWLTSLVGVLLNLLYLSAVGLPEINWSLLTRAYLPCLFILVMAEIFFVLALKHGELSLIMPWKAFSPLLGALMAYVFFEEVPAYKALWGVGITMVGAYGIYLKPGQGIFAPLAAIAKDVGGIFMFLCLFFSAVNACVQRYGAKASSPVFFFTLVLAGQLLVFTLLLLRSGESFTAPFRNHRALTIASSLLWGLGITLLYVAWNFTLIVYVSVISQLQLVLSVPIGYYFFGEGSPMQRLGACLVMVVGAIIMVMWA